MMHRFPLLVRCLTGALWLLVASLPCAAEKEGVQFSRAPGLYDRAFELSLSADGGFVEYTTDGGGFGSPAATRYERPLRVERTTIVRAWARGGDGRPRPSTRSFIFPRDVAAQTGAGFPPTWGAKDGKPVPAFYGVSKDVVPAGDFAADLDRALRAVPTMSLVLDPADLFGADAGIYAHPEEKGKKWERRGSVELIDPGGGEGFRSDCAVRIQGGWGRRPEESPKHGLRLTFDKSDRKTAAGKLPFDHDVTTLVLRAGNNNTFLHPSGEERRRAEYGRDQWMRESYAAMGHPSAPGFFVHLYLNGLYWGLYNATERPDSAFLAGALGGKKKDYDVRAAEEVMEGDAVAWDELVKLAEAGVESREAYEEIGRRLDVPAFADYMLLNLYGANGDWDAESNWYAARRRDGGRFFFIVWDAERTLESVDANVVDYDAPGSPPRLFQRLRKNPDFRLAFAGRARQHLLGDGVLTPTAAARRYRAWSDRLDASIVGESARWGGYRRDVHPFRLGPYELYTRDGHFRPEVERLMRDYFPRRTGVLLEQLRRAGLYPPPDAGR